MANPNGFDIPVKDITIEVPKFLTEKYVKAVMDSGFGFGLVNYDINPNGTFDYVVFHIPDCSSLMFNFKRRLDTRKDNLRYILDELLSSEGASGQSF